MPNWTYNTLHIEHEDKNIIQKIKEDLSSIQKDKEGKEYTVPIDFNNVIPMPETLNVTSPLQKKDLMFYILSQVSTWEEIDELPYEVYRKIEGILPKKRTHKALDELRMEYLKAYTKDLINGIAEKKHEFFGHVQGEVSLLQGYKYYKNITTYGYDSWYDWCCNMWGTKWNACDSRLTDESDTKLEYHFDTAWSAPWPIAAAISYLYKDAKVTLEAEYEDPSGRDCVTFVNGKVVRAVNYPDVYICNDKRYANYWDMVKAEGKPIVNEDSQECAEDNQEYDMDDLEYDLEIDEDNPTVYDNEDWDVNEYIFEFLDNVKKNEELNDK